MLIAGDLGTGKSATTKAFIYRSVGVRGRWAAIVDPKGEYQPLACALGMTYVQSMRLVILPQAFRNMVPLLLTQAVILFQDTSLVYVISATDFLGAAVKVANRDYRLVEMYLFAALVYFAISFTASQYVKRLQLRVAVIR